MNSRKRTTITAPTFGTPMALRKYLEYTETDPTDLQGVNLTKIEDLGFMVGAMDDAVFIKDVDPPDGPLSHLSLLKPGMLILGMTLTFRNMPLDVALGILSTCAKYDSVLYVRKDHVYDVNEMNSAKLPRVHLNNDKARHYRQRSNDTSAQLDGHLLSRSSSFTRDSNRKLARVWNRNKFSSSGGSTMQYDKTIDSSISDGLEVTEDFIQSGKHILSLKQWEPPEVYAGVSNDISTMSNQDTTIKEERYLNVDIVSPAPNYIAMGEEIQFMGDFRHAMAAKYSNIRSRVAMPNWLRRRRGMSPMNGNNEHDDALSTKTF